MSSRPDAVSPIPYTALTVPCGLSGNVTLNYSLRRVIHTQSAVQAHRVCARVCVCVLVASIAPCPCGSLALHCGSIPVEKNARHSGWHSDSSAHPVGIPTGILML